MTRTLDDTVRTGCELNTESSHRAPNPGITFEANRHTASGWRLGTLDDKDPCPRDCLELINTLYNAGGGTDSHFGQGRRVVPTRATSYYPAGYDSRRIHAAKVVITGVAT